MRLSIVELVTFFILLVIYFGPIIFVIIDKKTAGREKVGWTLLTFFFGFLAIPFYLIKTNESD